MPTDLWNAGNPQNRLRSQVGAAIQNLLVEFWLDDPKQIPTPVCVNIQFRNGSSFILSCGGDGGVSVRNGLVQPTKGMLQIRRLDCLTGAVVESIEFSDARVVISTSGHLIQIANHDDEMDVTVNGCDLWECLDVANPRSNEERTPINIEPREPNQEKPVP